MEVASIVIIVLTICVPRRVIPRVVHVMLDIHYVDTRVIQVLVYVAMVHGALVVIVVLMVIALLVQMV